MKRKTYCCEQQVICDIIFNFNSAYPNTVCLYFQQFADFCIYCIHLQNAQRLSLLIPSLLSPYFQWISFDNRVCTKEHAVGKYWQLNDAETCFLYKSSQLLGMLNTGRQMNKLLQAKQSKRSKEFRQLALDKLYQKKISASVSLLIYSSSYPDF